jgi:oxepin-CoA hydrolase / 3-oxo-5,6-dehydrosuberyl-CoA semialdehyde dehydrogenase
MTVKAGQKCTAVRRTIVPQGMEEDVIKAIRARLDKTVVGDPSVEGVRMGPLASKAQVRDVGDSRRSAFAAPPSACGRR